MMSKEHNKMPNLYIIAGCNGAGKTTASFTTFETTLASRTFTNFIKKTQTKRYVVTLLFFWLSSPEMAIQRVAQRVKAGGHNIEKDVISRRYKAGIRNLFNLYMPICDFWIISKNSEFPNEIIALGDKVNQTIYNPIIYNKISKYE